MDSHRINNDPIRERERDGEIKKIQNKTIHPVCQLNISEFCSHSVSQTARFSVSMSDTKSYTLNTAPLQ